MKAAFDATFLLYLFAPPGHIGVPMGANGKRIEFAKERVEGLIDELERAGATVIVSTPALSEIMVRAGVAAGQKYLSVMKNRKAFRIAPFDEKSAMEVAIMAGAHVKGADLMAPSPVTHAKLKYDRQIVAIAQTEGATLFFTDDENQKALAIKGGMTVRGLDDCTAPPKVAQIPLEFGGANAQPQPGG